MLYFYKSKDFDQWFTSVPPLEEPRARIALRHGGSKSPNFVPGTAVIMILDIEIRFFAHFELKHER
jgi:hypothetical protein